jgi:signal transduction histidine kinase
VATGERFVVVDARESALLRESPAIEEHEQVAYAGAPLRLADGGPVLGTLCVVEPHPRHWTEDDLATLDELAEVAETELNYRVQAREVELVCNLALRLPDPVDRLGDAVRTIATLVERPEDPRLPRTADVARERFQAVETLTEDLTRAAAAQRRARPAEAGSVELNARLARVIGMVQSAARRQDLVVEMPPDSLWVRALTAELDRALSLTLVTALHHAGDTGPVKVRLRADSGVARLSVVSPGFAVPVNELLRVVGGFRHEPTDAEPVDVTVRAGVTRVRGALAEARTGSDGTIVEVALPLETPAPLGAPEVPRQVAR